MSKVPTANHPDKMDDAPHYVRFAQHFDGDMPDNFERSNRALHGFEPDSLPLAVRVAMWVCVAGSAAVLALLAGMFALHLMAVAAATVADPLAGVPW